MKLEKGDYRKQLVLLQALKKEQNQVPDASGRLLSILKWLALAFVPLYLAFPLLERIVHDLGIQAGLR